MEPDGPALVAADAGADADSESRRSAGAVELSLGLLILVWDRLNATPGGGSEATTPPPAATFVLGAAASTAQVGGSVLSSLGRRAAAPAGFAASLATSLPGARALAGALSGTVGGLRRRGEGIADRARCRTAAFLRVATADGSRWAEVELAPPLIESMVPFLAEEIVPELLEGLMPHLLANFAPRLVEGLLPEIREKVLPVIIEDVATDPRVRAMVLQQSRGALAETTGDVRARAATADDWLELRFRRLLHRPARAPDGDTGASR